MRRAAKRDANEPALVKLARDLGAVMVFAGPLDWWCFWRAWHPVEIKNPEGKNQYTDDQKKFLDKCYLRNAPVWTWRSERDVFDSFGVQVP